MFLKSSIAALAISVVATVPASADSAPKGALHVAPDENLPISASTLTPIYSFKMIDEAFEPFGGRVGQIADIRDETPTGAMKLIAKYLPETSGEAFGTLGDFGQIADIRGETPTGAVKLMVSYNHDTVDGTMKTFDAGIAQLADTRGETPTGAMKLIAKYGFEG